MESPEIIVIGKDQLLEMIRAAVRSELEIIKAPVPQSDILTMEDLCTLTGYSRSAIHGFLQTNSIPKPVKRGKKLFFSRAAIEKWIYGKRN